MTNKLLTNIAREATRSAITGAVIGFGIKQFVEILRQHQCINKKTAGYLTFYLNLIIGLKQSEDTKLYALSLLFSKLMQHVMLHHGMTKNLVELTKNVAQFTISKKNAFQLNDFSNAIAYEIGNRFGIWVANQTIENTAESGAQLTLM